ncbi:MAG: hypothetical protein LCH86_23970 [Proteobacteria bacterium]|nr:hypothetical protein [Pseudomonadota bacterium]
MTEAEVRSMVDEIAKQAAKEAVKEVFLTLGIETDEALEVQKDMQHLRAWREAVATVKRQSLMTAIGIITAGVLGLVWLAVKGTP